MRQITRWDEELNSSSTDEVLKKVSQILLSRLEALGSEKGREIAEKLDNFPALCEISLDYSSMTPYESSLCRQVLAFFTKRSDLDAGVDRRKVAERKFIDSEVLCANTNAIFRKRAAGEFFLPRRVESLLFRAQRKIAHILGDVPTFSDLAFRFGPGASTTLQKRKASARAKLGEALACSEDFGEFLREFLEEFPGWINPDGQPRVPVVIHDGKLDFVPKTAKTDRAIVVEPMLNSMFQLGVGDFIARRLRAVGIDIRDQSRNQNLAHEGSLTGALATLDLSSASDTIATELVYELLPVDWALFLARGRTSHVRYSDFRFSLEKFSSMGNGFTFPLETLIFYALAYACAEGAGIPFAAVYGDDIVVPTEAVEDLTELLHCCGFILNKEKSFSSGPFRESCGCDYHSGINIRPCYIEGPLSGQDVFRLHNHFVRLEDVEVASVFVSIIHPELALWGPDHYGDGHLIGGPPLRPYGREKGYSGYAFETYTYRARWDFTPSKGDHVLPLYSTYLSEGRVTHAGSNAQYAFLTRKSSSTGFYRWRSGRLGVSLPGKKGYNRITIYTLTND